MREIVHINKSVTGITHASREILIEPCPPNTACSYRVWVQIEIGGFDTPLIKQESYISLSRDEYLSLRFELDRRFEITHA
ncbi:MAG: hypothetical protein ACK5MB_00180 [Phycisphaerales bacterium]|jgi:hypothetical protein